MCVQKLGLNFEGPAQTTDFSVLHEAYPGIDFLQLHKAMSVYGFVPLATDLAMMGAVLNIPENAHGVQLLPFAGVRSSDMAMVKLPVMEGIVGWLENTVLGSEMWKAASQYLSTHHGVELFFTMDCGCGVVAHRAMDNGQYYEWLTQFNTYRTSIFGRTDVVMLRNDDIADTDIESVQLHAWKQMRGVLFALPERISVTDKMSCAA